MPAPQNLKNHTRWYPLFHFFLLPMLLLNIILSIYVTIHHWPVHWCLGLWWIAMALVFFVMAGVARGGAIKVQDRVIRLEERLRLAALLPAEDRAHIDELTVQAAHRPPFRLRRRAPRARPQNPHPKPRTQSYQAKHRQLAWRLLPRLVICPEERKWRHNGTLFHLQGSRLS